MKNMIMAMNEENLSEQEINYLAEVIQVTLLDSEAIAAAHQADHFRQLEHDWRVLLSTHPDNKTLIEYYGKEDVISLCNEKICELNDDFVRLNRKFSRDTKYLQARDFCGNDRPIYELYIEYFENQIRKVRKELDRLSLFYLTAQNRLPKPKNGLTDEMIQRAREYPLDQLYSGRLRKVGRRFTGLCPFHEERTHSFVIYDNNSFHCFGCQAHGGNAIDYLMKLENIGFKKTVGMLGGR